MPKKPSPLTPTQRREAQADLATLGKPRSLRPGTQPKRPPQKPKGK